MLSVRETKRAKDDVVAWERERERGIGELEMESKSERRCEVVSPKRRAAACSFFSY